MTFTIPIIFHSQYFIPTRMQSFLKIYKMSFYSQSHLILIHLFPFPPIPDSHTESRGISVYSLNNSELILNENYNENENVSPFVHHLKLELKYFISSLYCRC